MNERIRELSNQAVKAADAEYELKWQSKDPSLEPWEFIFRRTFAELIVKECVLISRTSTDGFTAGQQMLRTFVEK